MSGTINGRANARPARRRDPHKRTVAGSVRRTAADPADRLRDASDPELRSIEASTLPPNTTRPNARQRGYNHRWDKARATFLRHNPLCRMCESQGRVTEAKVVDHIIPHRGDQALFWDTANNWQPLCYPCHNSVKQREERGTVAVIGDDGWPIG